MVVQFREQLAELDARYVSISKENARMRDQKRVVKEKAKEF